MVKKTGNLVSRFVRGLNCFDLKGRSVAGIFSLVMIILCIYVTLTGSDIPNGVLMAYGAMIGGLTVGKTAEVVSANKAEVDK